MGRPPVTCFPCQACPKYSLDPSSSFLNGAGRGPNTRFARVPLTPGDRLAGNRSLHVHRPLDPCQPPSAGPPSQSDHPVPPPSLCVCASLVCRTWCPSARGTLWTCPRTQRASCRSRRSGLKSPVPWRPRPPAGAACCLVRRAGPRSARETG